MTLRIIFMGTSEFSIPTLRALSESHHKIYSVYTKFLSSFQNNNFLFRKSPVHYEAEKLNLPIYTPFDLQDFEKTIQLHKSFFDIVIVVAYGFHIPDKILNIPKLGFFNVHASLLPKWRGAAPIQRSIMNGDYETGITIIKMNSEIDAGPIVMSQKISIGDNTTFGELSKILSYKASDLVIKLTTLLDEKRSLILTPQDQNKITYAKKITKDETRINWNKSSYFVHKHICGLSPTPGSWCEMKIFQRKERIKILKSKFFDDISGKIGFFNPNSLRIFCKNGSIIPIQIQKSGGKPLEIKEFLRGARILEVF